ncbi:sensor histidine kinase [Paenibacillus mendelii]|uniref:Heme sensor protein HssS n=1 Tax=Paenibacillus mendelii TaxID=206163 RepID=A0ABV6J9N8_9BACL|nr:HAMP domain-containing sensor histidine kinase [Paenibacillus mendelii]MCQ6561126.1 HAMP domain-containing histidine kinase [Paenibacillus mendelii]
MKTLYVRIVVTFIAIAIISCIIGLLLTNFYYQEVLHSKSQQKIWNAGQTIRTLLEQNPNGDTSAYLTQVASLGYQIYYVDEQQRGASFGAPFKHGSLSSTIIQSVLDGGIYKGVDEENNRFMLLAFFENSLRNTVGLPLLAADGEKRALFVRPDLEQQIGELRLIVAVLFIGTFVISLLLIVILSRYIVKPVKALTSATKQIVEGRFDVVLDVSRKDELGDLALHFTKMTQAIKQLDDMRQEFVANVSHEMQSPLTSIRGLAQASLDHGTTAGETEYNLRIIEQESRRLSELSKQLLTLASLDKENQALQITKFQLDEQLRQIIIMQEWQWSEKQLQLQLELPETWISGDAQLLYEVWLNLISNAIKFSSTGGMLSVQIEDADDDTVLVHIADTGAGIPESDMPHLFERFHKADKARNRTTSGSGLGLAIAHKIVTLHHGRITAHSQYTVGSTFTVTLPRL